MYKFCIKVFLIISLPFVLNFAQKKGDISVLISANLTKEQYIQLPGNLNFDNIAPAPTSRIISRYPDKGIKIKIVGKPDKNIILTYSQIKINNYQWASENGSNKGTISFTPDVKYLINNNSPGKSAFVKNGSPCILTDSGSDGTIFLWIGGKIKIADNQPRGDYFGIFQIKVAYE